MYNIQVLFFTTFSWQISHSFSFLERSGGVSIAAIKDWLSQILEAISFLHEKGVVHRNLRLSCIYYEGTVEGRLKIGDLGTAKLIGAPVNKAGIYKGISSNI